MYIYTHIRHSIVLKNRLSMTSEERHGVSR